MRVRSRAYNPPVLDAHALPNDVESLKRLLLEREETVQARDVELREKQRQIEHLKLQLAKLWRPRFGQFSETFKDAGYMRRKFFDLDKALKSPLTKEALDHFHQLYRIEKQILGRSPAGRLATRTPCRCLSPATPGRSRG